MLAYYYSQIKSPPQAVLYALWLPSAGHAYAGNWGRGLLFAACEIGALVVAVSLGIEELRILDAETEVNALFYIGIMTAIGLRIFEFVFDCSR